ncbi:MAG TPA: dihydrolipoamide acetyltransferase family protein [Trebonia sp.]|nr:dihydrolipoamide acetyltransferase family protein [Trebonia sp.]
MPDFLLPDLGEGLTEAEVIAWRVRPGDHVAIDQVIAEVETAKAVVEVPVPYAGTVARLHAEPGTVVSVGQPLVTITAEEPATGLREPGVVVPGPAAASEAAGGEAAGADPSGSVLIGYGTTAAPARARRHRRRALAGAPAGPPPPDPAPAVPADSVPADSVPASSAPANPAGAAGGGPTGPAQADSLPAAPGPGRPGRLAVVSPLVRKEARDAGLDLASLTGTGPDGLVRRQDVRRAIAARDAGPATAPIPHSGTAPGNGTAPVSGTAPGNGTPPGNDAAPDAGTAGGGAGERRVPLRGARRVAAEKLSRSRREIPEATVWVDADATALVETRAALNAADPARPVSLLALLARFALAGLRRFPELNARIEGDEIVLPGRVNLGFAAQTAHGLVVPVVPDAHRLATRDLSAQLAQRAVAARERRLAPADLAGGTFTVNNYGMFGVDGSAAIINYPEVAILGMGRVIDRPWVVGGGLAVRKVTELTLAFDHRACDGGTAGGFLRYVADCIESPATAIGDM